MTDSQDISHLEKVELSKIRNVDAALKQRMIQHFVNERSEFGKLIGEIRQHVGRWERSGVSRKKAIENILYKLWEIHFNTEEENE